MSNADFSQLVDSTMSSDEVDKVLSDLMEHGTSTIKITQGEDNLVAIHIPLVNKQHLIGSEGDV